MTELEERAREIFKQHARAVGVPELTLNGMPENGYGQTAIDAMLAMHAEAVEACAGVAEMWDHRGDIAARIRALSPTKDETNAE